LLIFLLLQASFVLLRLHCSCYLCCCQPCCCHIFLCLWLPVSSSCCCLCRWCCWQSGIPGYISFTIVFYEFPVSGIPVAAVVPAITLYL
jgi:hypothetical protein